MFLLRCVSGFNDHLTQFSLIPSLAAAVQLEWVSCFSCAALAAAVVVVVAAEIALTAATADPQSWGSSAGESSTE